MYLPPSSFCTICTHHLKEELVGFLLSISVHHPNTDVYLFLDRQCKQTVDAIMPYLKVRIHSKVNLNEWDDTLATMRLKGSDSEFLSYRIRVMDEALRHHSDTCLMDVDGIFVDKLIVNKSKDLGLSDGFPSGSYGSALVWTKVKALPQRWLITDPETLTKEFDTFVFGHECDLNWRRIEEATEPVQKMLEYFEEEKGTRKPLFKKHPIVFVHTHFSSPVKAFFNTFVFNMLMKCKKYKESVILQRVMHRKWYLNIPRQPAPGIWCHNDDGFRELARIWESNVSDLQINYSNRHLNCFLEPNICLYDREGAEWFVPEVHKAPLTLMGNLAIKHAREDMRDSTSAWIAWYRHPMILEEFLRSVYLKDYQSRNTSCAVILETNANESTRNYWESTDIPILSDTKTQHAYLKSIADARFVMCFEPKSNSFSHVELIALGTVPIVQETVDMKSYMEPLVEGTHYLQIRTFSELKNVLKEVDESRWTRMSAACKDWYVRNAHSTNTWIRTLRRVLYDERSSLSDT
jgi:hypothetical protein